ncbi:hypothetical protein [Emcibacter sp. SYSU 3D8]|uniref:hypothetical protein n=1 Tax=Emcibacter sp. SYSU 3D8 TaxID=3133969 RepID=UPI0031FEBDD2
MSNIRQAGHGLIVLCATLLTTAGPAPSAELPGLRIVESRSADFSPYDEVPARFPLRGIVVDQRGAPMEGARISVDGEPGAAAASDGGFVLSGMVPATAIIRVSHPDAVAFRKAARDLFTGEGGRSEIVLTRYTASFPVTPAGGVYRSDGMTLDVPPGAVREAVTVHAAVLPPDLSYDESEDPQPTRVTGVALAPEGLIFQKAVKLRVPVTGADGPAAAMPLLFNERSGRYGPAAGASVSREGADVVFSVMHFSRYAAGDPSEGMERRLVKRTVDLNGDGGMSTQDAEFVVILSGGDHGAQWVKSTGSASAVMRTKGSSSSSSSTDTKGASGGVSFGGVGVEVSGEVSSTEAQEVASSVGNGSSSETSQTVEFKMATPEYDTDCAYVLRWYEYWRIRKWTRHTPGEKEAPGLQSAYDDRSDSSSDWGYFDIVGSRSIAVGRTIYGGDKIAVRKTAAGYEYYRLKAEYLVRVPKGLHVYDCKAGKPNEKAAKDGPDAARFFGGGAGMKEAAFDGSTTTRYLGWGVLPDSLPERYTNMECRRETAGEITIKTETEQAAEDTVSKASGKASSIKAEAKAEIPVVGVQVGGGVSASRSIEESRSSSASYARKFTNQVSTTVRWEINDPHKPRLVHWSDHELHKLYLLLETRSWSLASDSQIPPAVRDAAGSGGGRSYVATAGGGMVMRDSDGSFLIAGPPVVVRKEIGFMLVRIAQRPCPGTPTTPDESGSGDDSTGDDDSGGQRGGRATTPSGAGSATTPGPTGSSQQQGAGGKVFTPRGNMENYTAVSFTALDNETVITRGAIGDVQSVTFVAVDGTRMPDKERGAKVTTDDDSVRLDAGDAVGVGAIIIGGTTGSVELFKPRRAPPASATGAEPVITPQDGDLDIRNGAVRETLRVPDSATDPAMSPAQHQVTLGGQPLTPVAVREGEIAVTGSDVPLSAAGDVPVRVTAPDGTTTEAQVPTWAFTVTVQPVTRVGQTVPVMFQAQGVEPDDRLEVELLPSATQTVSPSRVTLDGGQLAGGQQPIARLTAQVPGPQVLNVRVTRRGGPVAPP